jgi:hypothetical protein
MVVDYKYLMLKQVFLSKSKIRLFNYIIFFICKTIIYKYSLKVYLNAVNRKMYYNKVITIQL